MQSDNQSVVSPHTTINVKEADLDRHLVIDRYRRHSLVDHFLDAGTTLARFAQVQYEEYGNFIEQLYDTQVEQRENGLLVTLARQGQLRRAGALSPISVQVTKTLFVPLGQECLHIRYAIENRGQTRLQSIFGCEWNMHLLGGGANDQAYYRVAGQTLANGHFDSTGEVEHVEAFDIGNSWLGQNLSFSLSEPATLWRFSIDTVTGSEAGFERNHQGSCMTLLWPLLLDAGQTWQGEIHVDFS